MVLALSPCYHIIVSVTTMVTIFAFLHFAPQGSNPFSKQRWERKANVRIIDKPKQVKSTNIG